MICNIKNDELLLVDWRVTDFALPEGVTRIADYAFWGCQNLFRITLPSTLRTIAPKAMLGCGAYLVEIVNHSPLALQCRNEEDFGGICAHVVSIVRDKSEGRSRLTEDKFVLLDDAGQCVLVRYAGRKRTVTVPDGVTEIGAAAFSLVNADNVILSPAVRLLRERVFAFAHVPTVVLPATVGFVGERAFDDSEIHTLVIQNPRVVLATGVLYNAYCLRDLYFEGSKEQFDRVFDKDQPYSADFVLHTADGQEYQY